MSDYEESVFYHEDRTMTLREILSSKGSAIFSIHPQATLHDAARQLIHHRVGALLVLNEDHQGRASDIQGIITERDLLRAYAQDCTALENRQVAEVMSKQVITGTPDDQVEDVMGFMTRERKRHLPIVAENRIVGVVSIGDVVKAQHARLALENRFMKDYISS